MPPARLAQIARLLADPLRLGVVCALAGSRVALSPAELAHAARARSPLALSQDLTVLCLAGVLQRTGGGAWSRYGIGPGPGGATAEALARGVVGLVESREAVAC